MFRRGLLLIVLVAGGLAGLSGAQPPGRAAPALGPAPAVTGPLVADKFQSDSEYAVVAVPVRLSIPALRVQSRLERLGLQADGTVAVPESPHVAGWYEHGPRPGQPGPAVILGHVDSKSGPGVSLIAERIAKSLKARIPTTPHDKSVDLSNTS